MCRRRKSPACTGGLRPVNPQLRTSSAAQTNFQLCAINGREQSQQSCGHRKLTVVYSRGGYMDASKKCPAQRSCLSILKIDAS
jgi:hypothetical protein